MSQIKYSTTWESIGNYSERLRVPGGWLIHCSQHYDEGISHSVCFIPDPNNEWILE